MAKADESLFKFEIEGAMIHIGSNLSKREYLASQILGSLVIANTMLNVNHPRAHMMDAGRESITALKFADALLNAVKDNPDATLEKEK
jgi:hypothetical protein